MESLTLLCTLIVTWKKRIYSRNFSFLLTSDNEQEDLDEKEKEDIGENEKEMS